MGGFGGHSPSRDFADPSTILFGKRSSHAAFGFQETVVLSGLTNPTTVQFSKDGRVFVAEKSGLIKVFDNLSDTTPTTFADLRTNVHNFWDRGMLGMVLRPQLPHRSLRLRPLHSRRRDRRDGAALGPARCHL